MMLLYTVLIMCLAVVAAQDMFPEMSGKTLGDAELALPAGFTAPYTLVLMPLQQDHEASFRTWETYLKELEQQNPGFEYLQILPIGDVNFLLRGLITNGLKGTYDDLVRPRTMPVFGDSAPLLASLGIETDAEMVVLLIDGGDIVWRTAGDWSAEKVAQLETFLQSLQAD